MILIGTAGPAGSGKDTVADYLVEMHGFTKMAFAGPLKAMMAAAGMAEPADRAMKEQPIPGFDFTWREAAQKLGTEWGRGLDPEIWTKIVRRKLESLAGLKYRTRIVLTDIRFENEAQVVRELGGQVWHMLNRSADLGVNAGHISEGGVMYRPHEDELIDNSGSLDQLYEQVETYLAALLEGK